MISNRFLCSDLESSSWTNHTKTGCLEFQVDIGEELVYRLTDPMEAIYTGIVDSLQIPRTPRFPNRSNRSNPWATWKKKPLADIPFWLVPRDLFDGLLQAIPI